MVKKILTLVIILLFLGTCITQSVAIDNEKNQSISISSGNTLYVGGTGPNNYTTIQEAIWNATKGDTVYVYGDSSPYYECIIVGRSINLIGENKNTTVIDGQNKTGYDTIKINADFVNISGFTIQHCGTLVGDAGIEVNFNYGTIKDNIITLNEDNGILIFNSDYNSISENIITQNHGDWYHGICLIDSHNNIFFDNNISNNGYGIDMQHSNNNIIKNNIINNNYNEEGNFGMGIWSVDCNNVTIINNNIINNHGRGIDLYDNENNIIFGNTIVGNGWGANNGDGICLRVKSNNNIIKRNIIKGNKRDGISFHDGTGDTINNLIIENTIEANDRRGIEYSGHGTLNNIIYHNNFFNNPINGYDEGKNIWDNDYPSGGNYWDDYNGIDDDGDGIGDTPYNISGGDNQDRYPLMEPWGDNLSPIAKYTWTPSHPEPGEPIFFDASQSIDFDGNIILYEWDWDNDGVFDENHTSPTATYSFEEVGCYPVTLRVADNDNLTDSKTKTVRVGNHPPETPLIEGPRRFKKGEGGVYPYTINSTDSEGDDICYLINWSNGTQEVTGYYASGEVFTINVNVPLDKGTYTLFKIKAIDVFGAESDWAILEVTVPRTRISSIHWLFERFPLLERLLTFLLL